MLCVPNLDRVIARPVSLDNNEQTDKLVMS